MYGSTPPGLDVALHGYFVKRPETSWFDPRSEPRVLHELMLKKTRDNATLAMGGMVLLLLG